MRVSVNRLGLAAYIKMHGADIIEVVGKTFVFESEKPIAEWQILYNNSCCMKHDVWVCELRHYFRADNF